MFGRRPDERTTKGARIEVLEGEVDYVTDKAKRVLAERDARLASYRRVSVKR